MTAVVVMGVSAAGKSSVACGLAERRATTWVDADSLHPAANLAKMASGVPLDDDDRWPWLDLVGERLAASDDVIVACSALRRSYRDRLRAARPDTLFVHLRAAPEVLARRAASRQDHFMPPALLASQLSTLEPLDDDERGVAIDVRQPLADVVDAAARWVDAHA